MVVHRTGIAYVNANKMNNKDGKDETKPIY